MLTWRKHSIALRGVTGVLVLTPDSWLTIASELSSITKLLIILLIPLLLVNSNDHNILLYKILFYQTTCLYTCTPYNFLSFTIIYIMRSLA